MKIRVLSIFALIGLLNLALQAENEVKNAIDSAGYTLDLVEEIRFGGEDDGDEYLWPSLKTRLMPAADGKMFIIDAGSSRILEFDDKGAFTRIIAEAGNGPGELQLVLSSTLQPDGTLVVLDINAGTFGSSPNIKRFSPDGTFKDATSTHGMGFRPATVSISPDGRYMGGLFYKVDMETGINTLKTGIVDLQEKKMINEFLSVESPIPDFSRMNDQAMWVGFIAKQFKQLYGFGVFTFDGQGNAYFGTSDKYKVTKYKPGSPEPLLSMSRKFEPYPLGDKEKEGMVDHFYSQIPAQARQLITKVTLQKGLAEANLPPRQAPITALHTIEDKAIMVIHYVDLKTRDNVGDIFGLDGKYLGQLKMADFGIFAFGANAPSPRLIFHKGKAYTILTDEDGEQQAVRYSYSLKK